MAYGKKTVSKQAVRDATKKKYEVEGFYVSKPFEKNFASVKRWQNPQDIYLSTDSNKNSA